MMQASILKISLLAALVAPLMNSPDHSASDVRDIEGPACATSAVDLVQPLDWQDLTITDLEQLAASGHPDAQYWQAMQAVRLADHDRAYRLLVRAGQAGSPDAWWRLSDVARRDGNMAQLDAFRRCAERMSAVRNQSI